MNDRRHLRVLIALSALILAAPVVVFLWPKDSRAGALQDADAGLELKDWPMSAAAKRGETVYQRYCIGCHGNEGRGDGPAAKMLSPKPRNFQHGAFKFRSTDFGRLPLARDLVETITWGLPGSSMPEFRLVPEAERQDVAQYVLHLATFEHGRRAVARVMKKEKLSLDEVKATRLADIKSEVWEERVTGEQALAVPPAPKVDANLLKLGEERYNAVCFHCHGKTGRGDGNSSFTLRDWKDDVIVPRDFTGGVFRAGSAPEDIFRRIKTGISGTTMGASTESDENIWAMAYYVLSLKDPSTYVNRVHSGRGSPGGER